MTGGDDDVRRDRDLDEGDRVGHIVDHRRPVGVALQEVGRELGLGDHGVVVGADDVRLPGQAGDVEADQGLEREADVDAEAPSARLALKGQLLRVPVVEALAGHVDHHGVAGVDDQAELDRRVGGEPVAVVGEVVEADQLLEVRWRELSALDLGGGGLGDDRSGGRKGEDGGP